MGSDGLCSRQLTKQMTPHRAGEDGRQPLRPTHQQPALKRMMSSFFTFSKPKRFRVELSCSDLRPHTKNYEATHWAVTHLFIRATTVESALQALPWYQGLPNFFSLCLCVRVCVETGGSWVASEIAPPPAEDHWKKKKMMTEHLLSPSASSSFYCLSVLAEVLSL